jgi:hypothetical protein
MASKEPVSRRIGDYLFATEEITKSKTRSKTRVWCITNKSKEPEFVGHVAWGSTWRQYVFVPDDLTQFNNSCLRDLAAFLDVCNAGHRVAVSRRKECARR